MLNNDLSQQIKRNFFYKPTGEQEITIESFVNFLFSPKTDAIFLLKGYAGTGKTTLISALVKTLDQLKQKCVLLAPTGRAAKVFSHYAGHPAYTIHRKIYRQRTFSNELDNFVMNANLHQHTLFIVDEASMIGDGAADGSPNLLQDLLFYVYSGLNCKLILLGDTAQLPPVGMEESPAMNPEVLKAQGMHVVRATITKTVRQKARSGILYNATRLRRALRSGKLVEPEIKISGFQDVAVVEPENLEEVLGRSFAEFGEKNTLLITRSNRRAADFNLAIRKIIYDREEDLCAGERLIIAKNNYYWTRPSVVDATSGNINGESESRRPMDFIANGDSCVVEKVFSTETHAISTFADVRLYFPDLDWRVDAKLNLDTLRSDTSGLPNEKREWLYRQAMRDAGVGEDASPTAIRKVLKADPFYNALQVKFGYAVTCHKAQGGQWPSVFVDMGYIPPEAYSTVDFFRWLYTAVTRANRRLTLINPSVKIV